MFFTMGSHTTPTSFSAPNGIAIQYSFFFLISEFDPERVRFQTILQSPPSLMSYTGYVCKQIVSSDVRALFSHLRSVHFVCELRGVTLRCGQGDCVRCYSSFNSLACGRSTPILAHQLVPVLLGTTANHTLLLLSLLDATG